MQIGAVGFQPYIYNTNAISRSSLNKIDSISDDVISHKTDYSGLTSENENINPLGKGETSNFMDILSMQLQMGQNNASRIMKPEEDMAEAFPVEDTLKVEDAPEMADDILLQNKEQDIVSQQQEADTPQVSNVSDITSGLNVLNMVQGVAESASSSLNNIQQNNSANFSRFQMSHAAQAYAFMMAM